MGISEKNIDETELGLQPAHTVPLWSPFLANELQKATPTCDRSHSRSSGS